MRLKVRDTQPKIKNKNWPKVTWSTFKILGPPNISETAEDTNLKFCMQIDREG